MTLFRLHWDNLDFQLLFRCKRAVEIKPRDNIVGLMPQKRALEKLKLNMQS